MSTSIFRNEYERCWSYAHGSNKVSAKEAGGKVMEEAASIGWLPQEQALILSVHLRFLGRSMTYPLGKIVSIIVL